MQQSDMPLQTLAGLAVHLALGFLAAAGVAIAIGQPTALALAAGVGAGLLVTIALQRTVWLITNALDRLGRGLSAAQIPTRWHFLLTSLVTRLNVVLERVNSITALREGLVRQTGDAAAQQERNRLARELHDSIKQQVFSISMSAAAVEARWESDREGARQALDQVRQSAKEALVEMTALLQQLSPAPLEKVGLVQAIHDQCEALGYRTGAAVTARIGSLPADERLPEGASESLFRIVQEALSNIARHARAANVDVVLEQRGETVALEVRDDGQGFDAKASAAGMGITNIRGRVAALGGKLSLTSAPQQGTKLAIEVPLVEVLFSQEGIMVIKAEHTLNRVILAGAGGGVAMVAALFYPLFLDWPRLVVEGWPQVNGGNSLALSALAVLIVPVTGYIAARWARVGRRAAGTLFGALAGWLAALTAYVVLVAAASSVAASRAIFEWGLRPALDDPHALWLTAEPVINIVYATYISLWVMQIGGLALGALGGTFAPASTETVTAPELRNAALTISSLVAYVCGSTLSLAAVIFNPLVGVYTGETSSTGKPMAEAVKPYVFSFPPEGVAIIPVASALLLFATSMWVLYLVRAAQRRSGDPVELTGGFGLSVVITLLPVLSGMSVALAGSRPGLLLQIVIVTAVCVLFTVLFGAQTLADLRGRQPGEPLFPEWNPLILVTFGLVLIGMLGSVGTAVFFPPYMNDFYLGLRWGIGALILLVGVLVGAAVYWWFAVRPQGVMLGSWIRSQFSSRNTQPRQLSRLWQGTLNAVTVGFPIALLLVSQVLPAALSMVMLVVTSISVFFSYEKESLSPTAAGVVETGLPNLVQTLYYTQAGAFGTVLLAIFVFIGIILLTMRIREVVVGRMSNRAQQDVNQPEAG